MLAAQGEKKIQVVSSPDNPYSKGSAAADTAFKVGDRYVYSDSDLLTKLPTGRRGFRVTAITDTEIVYNQGRVATDLAGNVIRNPRVKRTGNQNLPAEFVVGRRWSTRFEESWQNGDRNQVQLSFRITGREKITVPAGTFDAFVVEYEGWSRADSHKPVNQISGKAWYAPDKVRWEIAREHMVRNQRKIRQANRSELVEYEQA